MSQIAKKHLLAGIIYGDNDAGEYIYLPGGEVGTKNPICILERNGEREDVPLDEAARLVDQLTLHETAHPKMGRKSF